MLLCMFNGMWHVNKLNIYNLLVYICTWLVVKSLFSKGTPIKAGITYTTTYSSSTLIYTHPYSSRVSTSWLELHHQLSLYVILDFLNKTFCFVLFLSYMILKIQNKSRFNFELFYIYMYQQTSVKLKSNGSNFNSNIKVF